MRRYKHPILDTVLVQLFGSNYFACCIPCCAAQLRKTANKPLRGPKRLLSASASGTLNTVCRFIVPDQDRRPPQPTKLQPDPHHSFQNPVRDTRLSLRSDAATTPTTGHFRWHLHASAIADTDPGSTRDRCDIVENSFQKRAHGASSRC